jgi:hypothetical protein
MADKPSPAMIAALTTDPQHRQRDMTRLRAEGVAEGRQLARSEVIDWLNNEHELAFKKGDKVKQEAILEVTRALSLFMQGRTQQKTVRNPPKRPRK